MMKRAYRVVIIGCLLGILAPLGAQALSIQSVAVTASSTYRTYDENHLIDNSGMQDGLHDGAYKNMWMSDRGQITSSLLFDLGGQFTLSSADIWQYNFQPPHLRLPESRRERL